MLKRADFFLIVVLFVIAFGFIYLSGLFSDGTEYGAVVISSEARTIGTYRMDTDNIIEIKNASGVVTNKIEISGGSAKMIYAICPKGECIKQGAIKNTNETLVCLPNKVVVEILSGEDEEFDGVVR